MVGSMAATDALKVLPFSRVRQDAVASRALWGRLVMTCRKAE